MPVCPHLQAAVSVSLKVPVAVPVWLKVSNKKYKRISQLRAFLPTVLLTLKNFNLRQFIFLGSSVWNGVAIFKPFFIHTNIYVRCSLIYVRMVPLNFLCPGCGLHPFLSLYSDKDMSTSYRSLGGRGLREPWPSYSSGSLYAISGVGIHGNNDLHQSIKTETKDFNFFRNNILCIIYRTEYWKRCEKNSILLQNSYNGDLNATLRKVLHRAKTKRPNISYQHGNYRT